jgi:LacI family repressor for deo operon, udp, cdd, tsx, nupC, and nupG
MSHRVPFNMENQSYDDIPPLVSGCEFTGYDGFPMVAIDDFQASIDATRHLIDYGHREIAVITGDKESTSTKDRLRGFRKAMADAGLAQRENLMLYGSYTLEFGESATETLMLQKQRPSAIFCFSDEIALGCMYALRQHHFLVPEDISVIGFDNIPFAKYFAPPLTTIAQPTKAIGTLCAELLFELIDGKTPDVLRHVLPHELIIRDSTKRLS